MVGAVITAANANIVRDDLNFLASRPRAKTKRSTPQSIANNTIALITWDQEVYDTDAMHSTSTNTGRVTATTGGTYAAKLNVEFAANGTGFRGIHIDHSAGPTIVGKFYLPNVGAAVTVVLFCATDVVLAAAEYLYAEAWQTSGGALSVVTTVDFLSARLVAI